MKKCSKCGETKAESQFTWKQKALGRRHSQCCACMVQYNRVRYQSDSEVRDKDKSRNERTKQRNKEFVWNYLLAHPCVDCGFSDPVALDFDHRENKKYNVSDMRASTWSIASIKEEIAKCDVRCRNCHAIKTAKQLNYYRGVAKLD